MTIMFYIVKHMTFENENVIFSNRNDALKYINERKIELDKLYGCDIYHSYFKIIEIKEKERFDAFIKSEFIINESS